MSLAALMNLTATLTTVAQTGPDDRYGNPTEATTTTSVLCYAEQRSADEDTVNASTESQQWRLFFPATVEITADDRVTVLGLTLELTGPPWEVYNPRTGETSHIECYARQVV